MSMQVLSIYANNSLRNYQYLICGEKNICIDPFCASELLTTLLNSKLGGVDILINTHMHHDHIRGNQGILDSGDVIHDLSSDNIQIDKTTALQRVKTPGHTFDSESFVLHENNKAKAFFSGDTLFIGGVGNCYNGGNPEVLADTLASLDSILHDKIIIYPGHDYWENNKKFALKYFDSYVPLVKAIKKRDLNKCEQSTWQDEKKHNVFLLTLLCPDFRSVFFPGLNARNAFCKVRSLRDNF